MNVPGQGPRVAGQDAASAAGRRPQPDGRPDPELQRTRVGYRRVVEAIQGQPLDSLAGEEIRPNRKYVRAVRALSKDAELTRQLRNGVPLPDAVVATVGPALQGRLHAESLIGARALCQALHDQPETRVAGALGGALVAQAAATHDLAWDLFAEVPRDVIARTAPVEFLRAAAAVEERGVVEDCADWIDQGRLESAADRLAMAQLFFVMGANDVADRALRSAREAGDADETIGRRIDLLADFNQRALAPSTPEVPAGHVSFGVIDYKQPDETTTSSNVGDYVQTIASLGHLLRHQGLRLHGASDLVEVVSGLQDRVRPELRIEGGTEATGTDVQLVRVNRDASSYDAVPENTWTIAFGWYMQPTFGLSFDFPFHPNVNPLFISFHVNRPGMLTAEAIEYLRAHGPVGCRDWNTVNLLLSRGVPAFFSGCLTTTINTVFPDAGAPVPADGPVAYVDTPAPKQGAVEVTQMHEDVRWTSMADNIGEALGLLRSYREEFGRVVTSRLHCYLPSWSIGANVTFTPKNRADVRFAGLLDADEADLATMRDGIVEVLAPALALVLRGATADEVYAEWRRQVEPRVAAARQQYEAAFVAPTPSFDVAEACRVARESRVLVEADAPRSGEPVHVAVALDGNLKAELEVVIAGMVTTTERPLHVVALTREHTADDHQRLARLFPEVTFEWIGCDAIDYGPVLGMLAHITVSTMDRLLLPELLPEVDKIIYHDMDALTVADIGELYDLDLAGAPLAARPSVGYGARSGLGNILKQGRRLSDNPGAARDFYRTMYRRHPQNFLGFNAGILVLDLARLRADRFTDEYVAYVEEYGLNDQEILNCYAGSSYRPMDPAWNAWPAQETVTEPKIVHWAGRLKPWDTDRYVKQRDLWRASEKFVAARNGAG